MQKIIQLKRRILKMTEEFKGTCFAMCPNKERISREKENLLNILEVDEKTKNKKHKKADPSKIVKCYKRSSAGSTMNDPSELRPGPVLHLTVRYLLTRVIMRKDVNWTIIYEFIFDRLRAVRQDMVIQRLDVATCIRILNPIVKFHIYAAERMRDKSLKEYVPKFNDQHLVECIKQLLVLYDHRDFELTEENQTDSNTLKEVPIDKDRIEIETLYILLYLGDVTSITRGLSLPSNYRESSDIKKALNISRAWYLKNYVRVCREISQLSGLFFMAALNNLQVIRRNTWEIMSLGYKSKNLTFPGEKLQNILLYKNILKVAKDCDTFGLKFIGGNIYFEKSLRNSGKVANPEKLFNDTELNDLLPSVI